MKRVDLLTILLLFFTIGCMGRGDALDKNGFLESFQSSLRSQGLEVKKVQPSSNATMENEVPYKFSIKENGEKEDAIFIYFFKSSSQVES